MKKQLAVSAAAFAMAGGALLQGADPAAVVQDTAGTEPLPYRQFEIHRELPGKYQMVLFLHGAGERGSDNAAQLRHGARDLVRYCEQSNVKTVLLFPQCPAQRQWVDEPWSALRHSMHAAPSEPLAAAMKLLDEKIAEFQPAAVYAAGISMGGYGVWDLVSRRPEMFAGALPICGGGDTAQAAKLTRLPIFTIHGTQDGAVPVTRSRDMVKAIWAAGGDRVIYQEIPLGSHDVWSAAFRNPDTWKWLFAQGAAR